MRRSAIVLSRYSLRQLTVLHGHALVLDPADVTAELVLSFGVLNQLGLHRESPHLIERVPLQFHLIENLRADLDDLVRVKLCSEKKQQKRSGGYLGIAPGHFFPFFFAHCKTLS